VSSQEVAKVDSFGGKSCWGDYYPKLIASGNVSKAKAKLNNTIDFNI